MKRVLKYTAWGLAAIVVLALAAYFWAYQVATSQYEKQWTVHKADFPIPFPLRDDELAALAVRERKFREVSGELHARIGCRPARKRDAQPSAHALVDRSRQVAVDLTGLHARNLRRDVDFTRSPTIVFIRAGRIARQIRVGEVELLDPNGSPAVTALPLDDALQTVERNRRVEDPRQSQHGVVARKPKLPVVVR